MAIEIHKLNWNIGSHIRFEGTIKDTVLSGINRGMYTIQFFLGNPKSFDRKRMNSTDISEAVNMVKNYPMGVFTHAPYLYNLAGSKALLAWSGNLVQDRKTEHTLKELEYELKTMSNFERSGVILHPGNYPDRKKGLQTISQSINRIEFSPNSRLLLENSAGQGTSLATTFEEIQTIIEGVQENKKKYVGVCVDTAHIFGYGEYDLTLEKEIDRLFDDFDKTIGLERFWLLHLNDSKVKLGTRKDRHAYLGTGYIYEKSFNPLVYLLDKCQKYDIPIVLETHPNDMQVLWTLSLG